LPHASAHAHAAPPALASSLPRGSIAALLSPMASDVPQPSMPTQIPASLPFSVGASSYSFPTFTGDLGTLYYLLFIIIYLYISFYCFLLWQELL